MAAVDPSSKLSLYSPFTVQIGLKRETVEFEDRVVTIENYPGKKSAVSKLTKPFPVDEISAVYATAAQLYEGSIKIQQRSIPSNYSIAVARDAKRVRAAAEVVFLPEPLDNPTLLAACRYLKEDLGNITRQQFKEKYGSLEKFSELSQLSYNLMPVLDGIANVVAIDLFDVTVAPTSFQQETGLYRANFTYVKALDNTHFVISTKMPIQLLIESAMLWREQLGEETKAGPAAPAAPIVDV